MKRQQEMPGTEPPERDPDIEDALYAWFDAGDAARTAADAKKIKHASLLLLVKASGREYYPYLDPKTGKKRRIRVKETPKIVSERDVYRSARKDEDAELPDVGEAIEVDGIEVQPSLDRNADTVEKRTVRRKDVEVDLDPFAATRAAMDDLETPPESSDEDPVITKTDGTKSSSPKRGNAKRGK